MSAFSSLGSLYVLDLDQILSILYDQPVDLHLHLIRWRLNLDHDSVH